MVRTKGSLFILLICTVIFSHAIAQNGDGKPVEVASSISRVIIYPEFAFVTRSAKLSIAPGKSTLMLKNIPSWIDDETLQVVISPSRACSIDGISTEKIYLTRSSEKDVQQAYEKYLEIKDRIEDIECEFNVLKEEKKYLKNLNVWQTERVSRETEVRKVDVDELEAVRTFLKKSVMENLTQIKDLERKKRKMQPELDARKRKWNKLKSMSRLEMKNIVVEVMAEKAEKIELLVSYLISGASWYPVYNIRTNKDKNKVSLECKAVVQQSTCEDWNNAYFKLSTVHPYLKKERPELKPWYLGANTIQILKTNKNVSQFPNGTDYLNDVFGKRASTGK